MTLVEYRSLSRFALGLGMLIATPLAAQESAMSQAGPVAEVVAVASTATWLLRCAVAVPLVPAAGNRGLRQRLDALAPGREVHLILDRLRVDVDPGALYRVELTGTAKSAPVVAVGSFAVFGVSHREGATAQRSFVVTSALRQLVDSGGIIVRFVPDVAAAADARVSVGKISLVEQ
ncbi:MAG: hypothetical protein JNN30_02640 [Rhodanobacteraceae bacterium]|nr:hypothetical protein [Rhodanobacteraceae bacterium]